MKKIGSINEARMYKKEPKFYSLVSDGMFNRVVTSPEQLKENAKRGYADMGIKGGTKAAAKEAERRMKKRRKLEEDDLDLPMNKTPEASKMTTNSPRRTTSASTQVYNSMTDAKDPNWIQGAEDDIKRRGTKGKCTPITKKSCTGKAKALAKTFKKMAKKRDAEVVSKKEKAAMKEGSGSQQRLARVAKALDKKWDAEQEKTWSQDKAERDAAYKKKREIEKKSRTVAFKRGAKSQGARTRAYKTASDPSTPLDVAIRAGDALEK